jgi:hypothetical protein
VFPDPGDAGNQFVRRVVRMRMAGRIGKLALVAVAAGWLGAASASAAPNTGRISFTGGTDFTTAYFFRGVLQERNGFIAQPYGEMMINLYKAEGPFSGLSLVGGLWNSIHSEATNHGAQELNVLYEQDWYGGIQANFLDNALTTRAFWIAYTSPSDAFKTVQEVDLSAALDDSQWLGAFALKPAILFGTETENTLLGTERGQYLEVGVSPGFTLLDDETYPVTVTLPNKVGLGLDDYYDLSESNEDTFGYFSTGVKVSIPLAFIPEDYGTWSASGGVQVLAFGNNTRTLNHEDEVWTIGTWGISMAY